MNDITERLYNRHIMMLSDKMQRMMGTDVHVKTLNRWRDEWTPLRGLSVMIATGYLEAGERGDYAALQKLFRKIEKRDATLKAAKARRRAAICALDWDIKISERAERLPGGLELAESQEQKLRAAYDKVGNLSEAIAHLASAEFRGFAHVEKLFDADGFVTRLNPVPQVHWFRNGLNGLWAYNAEVREGRPTGDEPTLYDPERDSGFARPAKPVHPGKFLVREVEDPVDEIALYAFIYKSLAQKDWAGFIETFGIPSIFAELPPNVPEDQRDEYLMLAEAVVGDMRGVLPNGSKIHTAGGEVRGSHPFRDFLDYQDQVIVLAATSSKLTMLAESGSGTLAGGAHSDTFKKLAHAEAIQISEIFNDQFDRYVLGEDAPRLAYWHLASEQETGPKEFVELVAGLSNAGFEAPENEVAEATGISVTRKAQP